MINQSNTNFERPIFDGSKYHNPESFTGWTGLPDVISLGKWFFIEPNHSKIPNTRILDETLPVRKPNFENAEHSALSATWLGHATVCVKLDSVWFITDPVWSDRASPVHLIGPIRYRPPPVSIDQLPNLNFGVISHNHYDHLDKNAVLMISKRFHSMRWFVPLGLRTWMIDVGIEADRVIELNWGDKYSIDVNCSTYEIWCLPAQHWSVRGPFDRFKTLWSGWAIVGPNRKFYFAGDTGFCEKEFDKIGTMFGSFDLAAIPIGCYEPRWFMRPQHIDPEEAVKIHLKIRAKKSIGIHWGTYHMGSNEGYMDPKLRLMEEVKKAGLSALNFSTLEHGEMYTE